ncbi:hypothetical protein ACGFNY_04820 [Streptomyces chartreusis]|uniref:hypothetical protein n=1 Tax=Streptomyces chartreusis TaxID=1969 RepID=UPI00371A7A36
MAMSSLALTAKRVIENAWLHGAPYDLASQAAFALESAQLLQSPETAAESAVSADAVRLAEESVVELRREHEENARLRAELAAVEERLETLRALCDAADRVGIVSGGWFTVAAVRRATAGEPLPRPDAVTRLIAPTQALREVPDGEHYAAVHHDYRQGRSMPELGGV